MTLKQSNLVAYEFIQLSHTDRDFVPLVDSIIDRHLGRIHNTQSHVVHAIGVVQKFFESFPQHIPAIKASSKYEPFDLPRHPSILVDFTNFISSSSGRFGFNNEYSFDTLTKILPPTLGGTLKGGGGGGDELKRVIRLLAETYT
ncbi:hypothetical protein [Moraxella osloensis]|jgi:hypothetical protein|uniref:hypothetical protein n=1 Tax=Faucicola osloensis TaxID=34062 RepID=UPI0024317E82|nr:hypothetical protein [Moraxella osloensis]